jgi:glycine cleavage system regulatory protein
MLLKRLFSYGKKKFVVIGAGKDRIGIVKDIAGIIFNEDGNIADSRMNKLEQNFALMILVEIPERNCQSFQNKIRSSREILGIHLEVNEAYKSPAPTVEIENYKLLIEIIGDDQPGIVYSLTQHLASLGANIDKIDTFSYSAPMGGTTLFKVDCKVTLNKLIEYEKFCESVKTLENTLDVDVNIYRDKNPVDSPGTL